VRRLHLKLYLAVVGTLMAFTLAGAFIWHFFAPREAMWGVQSATGVAALIFEGEPPTRAQEDAMLEALSRQLRADVALYGTTSAAPQRAHGRAFQVTSEQIANPGWQVTRQGPIYNQALADGRRLIVHPRHRFLLHGLHLTLMLFFVAVALALIIYPITRGITARLERLKASVLDLGAGNLSARVAVEGDDEVATLARSFNDSAARVEQLVRSHKMLLANCSHELRTPLARIRMASEKLAGAGSPAASEMARSIAELDVLIGEMLLASRLDAMSSPERQEEVDLLALAAEEAVQFGCEAVGEPLHVLGDPTLLRRMLRNLLDNAQRHAGGATRVAVRASAAGEACVVVEDNGPGVPASECERIFEPFHRVSTRSGEASGTGLGLSIVRQVARAHGGDVTCEPAGRTGARFLVVLPRAPVRPDARAG
jgi:signal transduction histidine kinase